MKRACKDCEWGSYFPREIREEQRYETVREHWWSLFRDLSRPTGDTWQHTVPDYVICHLLVRNGSPLGAERLPPDWWCERFERREEE